jgi:hypothetical protein
MAPAKAQQRLREMGMGALLHELAREAEASGAPSE